MAITFPGESREYRAARNDLLAREIELRRLTEVVAAERRALPPGGIVPTDYVFTQVGADGHPERVRLSGLFAGGHDSLVVYHMMLGPGRTQPCAGCTTLLDGLNGAARHITQRVNLVVGAASPIERIRAFAAERGWDHLRLVSTGGSTFNRDYHAEVVGEDDTVVENPMLNVFHRDGGTIRHVWGSELFYQESDPGQHPRHNGTVEVLWNVLDLTPEGRGTDWSPTVQSAYLAGDGAERGENDAR